MILLFVWETLEIQSISIYTGPLFIAEKILLCLWQEVVILGYLADKTLICGLKWSVSWCFSLYIGSIATSL